MQHHLTVSEWWTGRLTSNQPALLALALGLSGQGDTLRLINNILKIRNKHMHRIWREYSYHTHKEDSYAALEFRADVLEQWDRLKQDVGLITDSKGRTCRQSSDWKRKAGP